MGEANLFFFHDLAPSDMLQTVVKVSAAVSEGRDVGIVFQRGLLGVAYSAALEIAQSEGCPNAVIVEGGKVRDIFLKHGKQYPEKG